MHKDLLKRIHKKDIKVGIIGLGYVGLPLAIRFSEVGIVTIGFDVDKNKVKKLNAGKSYINHINPKKVKAAILSGFKASDDFSYISTIDAIIICVPTPLDINKEPDLSFVKSTMNSVKPHIRENQLLVLESTTYPGTTEEKIISVINNITEKSKSKAKFIVGKNFFVGYSPEREDPGNKNFTTKTIPKLVSGHTDICLTLTKALYDKVVKQTVPVSSTRVAEMAKILENIHRAVNIGLVNELKILADKMNIDIYEVISAASTKPFGFTPFYPGPGLGGHCIPIDPFYLSWKAKELGVNTKFIHLAGEINSSMPDWVVNKALEVLRIKKILFSKAKILIMGVAYKKNVDDYRETPAFRIMQLLIESKIKIDYHDPYVTKLTKTRDYNFQMKSIDFSPDKIKKYDIVILVTDHDCFNYKLLQSYAKCIVDTRGRYQNEHNIIKA